MVFEQLKEYVKESFFLGCDDRSTVQYTIARMRIVELPKTLVLVIATLTMMKLK